MESWLLEPVPLAERGPRAKDEEIKQGGKGGWGRGGVVVQIRKYAVEA